MGVTEEIGVAEEAGAAETYTAEEAYAVEEAVATEEAIAMEEPFASEEADAIEEEDSTEEAELEQCEQHVRQCAIYKNQIALILMTNELVYLEVLEVNCFKIFILNLIYHNYFIVHILISCLCLCLSLYNFVYSFKLKGFYSQLVMI